MKQLQFSFDERPKVKFRRAPHNGSPTSREAAQAIEPHAPSLRARVFEYLCSRGSQGATDDEMQVALSLAAHTQAPRRVELKEAGCVRNSGHKRPTRTGRNAIVWIAIVQPTGERS